MRRHGGLQSVKILALQRIYLLYFTKAFNYTAFLS